MTIHVLLWTVRITLYSKVEATHVMALLDITCNDLFKYVIGNNMIKKKLFCCTFVIQHTSCEICHHSVKGTKADIFSFVLGVELGGQLFLQFCMGCMILHFEHQVDHFLNWWHQL